VNQAFLTDERTYLKEKAKEIWQTGKYDPNGKIPQGSKTALFPRIAEMTDDMLEFAGPVDEVEIVDENGIPICSYDDRMFFEAAWVHKYRGKYYLSYSTGYSRHIAYAIGDNPFGPFTFKGYVLKPVVGWTNHHSIVKFNDKWYLFYHDCIMSNGIMHLRTMKMTELKYNDDGTIITFFPDEL
jgi:hypothetical protein